ncbi:phospholipase D-like domain-containing protein [Runella limosa]|uniref:phospholipase D-like domain-containing protein n=1 Tax=Runella limosa TaxID=370978 RepID=UPI0003FD500C|nr:phospholipase D-like domain-containing protein [Runella limosa]
MREGEHQSYFDNIQQELADELRQARHTIFAAVAWFYDYTLLAVLEDKARKGVSVQLVTSPNEKNDYSRFESLNDFGGEIYTFGGTDVFNDEFMHHKFCVIDYKTVITGSYNWTKNATTNEENIVIINDSKVARQYSAKCLELIQSGKVIDFDNSNDIRLSITTPTTLVESGDNIEIFWKVENAEDISIEGIGSGLEMKGSHSVKINQTRIFKITAREGEFSKTKTLQIRVVEYPQVQLFKTSKEAIIRGQTVVLNWKTNSTETVEIDNGIGTVEINGSIEVAPTKDTIYKLTAKGETTEIVEFQKVLVYAIPSIKTINVPTPTKIELETDIGLFTTKIQSNIKLNHLSNEIIHRSPKINFLNSNISKRLTIKEISTSLNKEIHELEAPSQNKTTVLTQVKSSIFNRLEQIFNNDWRAMQVISQIRKTYDIK